MLTLVEKILFIMLVGGSLILTYITFSRAARIVLRGQGQLEFDRLPDFETLPSRVWDGLWALITQGRMIRHRRITSLVHTFIAWGFLFYFLVNLADVLEGFIPDFHFLGTGMIGNIYRLLADVLTVAILFSMLYFLERRFIDKDKALTFRDNIKLHPKVRAGIPNDSLIVGLFILAHVGFRFISVSFLVAQKGSFDPWQPFASMLAALWSGLPPAALVTGWHVSWWIALGLILVFLPYFPYTKHAHLFTGPFNFMTRPHRKALGAMAAIDFEDEEIEEFGATNLTDLHQTQIVDAMACIMCNRCQEVCPAYNTGKELSPSALEINKRYYIKDNMAALANGEEEEFSLLDFAISESAVWACTTCGACVDVCPVGNEPMFDILNIRQEQVLMHGEFPEQLKGAFNGMERNGNPWQLGDDRLAWTEELDFEIPTVEDNPEFDTLFWVGCAGAFDPHAQETSRSIAKILDSADINYAVLGNDEVCTCDSARRAGNDYLFYEMALGNMETFNELGLAQSGEHADSEKKKRIVTGCPHCLHSLGKEYQAYGGDYEVIHHTQLITELASEKRITLQENEYGKITYHDPCYLGRHNDIYDEPRKAILKTGMDLIEMGRNKSNSFCCGAGGAQMWKEEEHGTEAVNENRFAEAHATHADTLAVGCPFCARMMDDANIAAGQPMQVKDVATVVADSLVIPVPA